MNTKSHNLSLQICTHTVHSGIRQTFTAKPDLSTMDRGSKFQTMKGNLSGV